jgi:hypothetical protein
VAVGLLLSRALEEARAAPYVLASVVRRGRHGSRTRHRGGGHGPDSRTGRADAKADASAVVAVAVAVTVAVVVAAVVALGSAATKAALEEAVAVGVAEPAEADAVGAVSVSVSARTATAVGRVDAVTVETVFSDGTLVELNAGEVGEVSGSGGEAGPPVFCVPLFAPPASSRALHGPFSRSRGSPCRASELEPCFLVRDLGPVPGDLMPPLPGPLDRDFSPADSRGADSRALDPGGTGSASRPGG